MRIPAGFAPTKVEGESTVDEGLVIVDSEGNSYVWIEVPKTSDVYKTATLQITDFSNENCKKIEADLQNYANDYRNIKYSDTWYEGCGIDSKEKYDELKNEMLKSVYEKGGFFVGQYEVGYEQGVNEKYRNYDETSEERLVEHPSYEIPVIKANAYPYNWVRCSQAQELASSMNSGSYTSSLMFGIQWDLMLKFLEDKKAKTQEELKTDSTNWGNYANATFSIIKGSYFEDGIFKNVAGEKQQTYKKLESKKIILTTGATKTNSALNIYDIAGNMREWTLECYTSGKNSNPCCYRGGDYSVEGGKYPVYAHHGDAINYNNNGAGFRVTLY